MSVTRSNIIAQPVDVYIRADGADLTHLVIDECITGFTGVAVGEGKVKLTQDVHEEVLQDSTPAQIGVTSKLEIDILESTSTQLAALEAILASGDGLVDIFLMQAGTAAGENKTGWVFAAYGLTVGYEGVFTRKNANMLKIKAQKSFATASGAYSYSTAIHVTAS